MQEPCQLGSRGFSREASVHARRTTKPVVFRCWGSPKTLEGDVHVSSFTRSGTPHWSSARDRRCRCGSDGRPARRVGKGTRPTSTESETTFLTIREAGSARFAASLHRPEDRQDRRRRDRAHFGWAFRWRRERSTRIRKPAPHRRRFRVRAPTSRGKGWLPPSSTKAPARRLPFARARVRFVTLPLERVWSS